MVSKIINMKRILIIILCFTNLIAFSQSILVNNTSVNVSSDISFPYWLDSTSTLAIDSNVVSISVLEFNITPTTNGNSLVFNQAKSVTSQQTVPSGKTWKVESVLLDPSFVSTSNNNSSTTVVSGGGGSLRPVALSNESVNAMNLGAGLLYCDSLVEDGYDNWVVPTIDELLYVAGGGGIVPGIRSTNFLFSRTRSNSSTQQIYWSVELNGSTSGNRFASELVIIRCVRHAAVSVSTGGSSSSGGSGNVVSSSLTPIAISAESPNAMFFNQAMSYCDSLVEDGYDNWVLPTIDELTYAGSGGLELPFSKTTNTLWSRTPLNSDQYSVEDVYTINFLPDPSASDWDNFISYAHTSNYLAYGSYKTRCIRSGAVTVSSGGGSSSGGSSTPSTLGNGMPTMISNESTSFISLGDAILYCDSLSESEYDDWVMPNFDQISYAISGGCTIPDSRTEEFIWSRTYLEYTGGAYVKVLKLLNTNGSSFSARGTYHTDIIKCRCVR